MPILIMLGLYFIAISVGHVWIPLILLAYVIAITLYWSIFENS